MFGKFKQAVIYNNWKRKKLLVFKAIITPLFSSIFLICRKTIYLNHPEGFHSTVLSMGHMEYLNSTITFGLSMFFFFPIPQQCSCKVFLKYKIRPLPTYNTSEELSSGKICRHLTFVHIRTMHAGISSKISNMLSVREKCYIFKRFEVFLNITGRIE